MPWLPSWIYAGHDLHAMDSGALLREAEDRHAHRSAPRETDIKMENPGPCKVERWKIFLVRLSSRGLDVIIHEDRREGRRYLLQPHC